MRDVASLHVVRRLRAIAACVALLAVTGCRSGAEAPSELASSASPTTRATEASKLAAAPDFTLETLDGGTFTLSDHEGELPVVLNFWAPF